MGDVSERGFEALRLSIHGAWRIFGPAASYAVCVNSLPLDVARERTGDIPETIAWRRAEASLPAFLRRHLDGGLAEGVAWKFAPLRVFPDRYEIALDNDCILWSMPEAVRRWVAAADAAAAEDACVLAEDVAPAFGQFAPLCGGVPRNTGIRGLPPGFDLAAALRETLAAHPVRLVSELDEQGLQVAALSRARPPLLVGIDEVALCSPFPPHAGRFGSCGAHFVGLNMKRERPHYGGDALQRIARHWDERRPALARAVGVAAERPAADAAH